MGAAAGDGLAPWWHPDVRVWVLNPPAAAGLDWPGRFQGELCACAGWDSLPGCQQAVRRLDSQTRAGLGPGPGRPQEPHFNSRTQEPRSCRVGDSLNGSRLWNAGCCQLLSPWPPASPPLAFRPEDRSSWTPVAPCCVLAWYDFQPTCLDLRMKLFCSKGEVAYLEETVSGCCHQ